MKKLILSFMFFVTFMLANTIMANDVGTSPPNNTEISYFVLQTNVTVNGIAAVQMNQSKEALESTVVQSELTVNNFQNVTNIDSGNVMLNNQVFEKEVQYTNLSAKNMKSQELTAALAGRTASNDVSVLSNKCIQLTDNCGTLQNLII